MNEDDEIKILRLEKRAAVLTAENYKLRKRAEDLQRMYNASQKYIGKLQAQLKQGKKSAAERLFK